MQQKKVFNREIIRIHRDMAVKNIEKHDFLFKYSAEDIVDRTLFYKDSYSNILDLGCRIGYFYDFAKEKLKYNNLYQADISKKMLDKVRGIKIHCDEEKMPFSPKSFDLIVSNLNLHWANELPKTLLKIRNILKVDGRFVASIIGGSSLRSLRELLIKTEMRFGVDVGFHVSPMIATKSILNLMQAVKFKNIVVDTNIMHVNYKDVGVLFRDLKNMGESNALLDKRKHLNIEVYKYLLNNVKNFYCDFEIITVSANI